MINKFACHAGNETFEKLGAIGTLANLLVYLTTVFNLSSITATNIVNIFNGSASLATLLGAFLCDTYFGRYKTLGFCTFASFLVLIIIILAPLIDSDIFFGEGKKILKSMNFFFRCLFFF
jgi:peptide/histidine transporter 3/4